MQQTSFITLNKSALENNIQFLRSKFGKKIIFSSVVKANAYGHGIESFIPLLEESGINHYSVFNFDEAERTAKSLKHDATILIMGWISDERLRTTIEKGYEFYIFSVERLQKASEIAGSLNLKAKIHIEAETGMNRTGLNLAELAEVIKIINEHPGRFEVVGFCTHLAGPESISNYVRIQKQMKLFKQMQNDLNINGITPQINHIANSAAAMVYPTSRMDLVRIGIMQYGFWSSAETFIHYVHNKSKVEDPLRRVLSWRSFVMSVKEIKTGEFVGYGTQFLAQHNMRTAIIPLGYATGYSRSFSNKGRVLINGQRCGVIGLVNMNMIIADVTTLPDVKIGDEVVIIGKQGDLEISVSAFSDITNELNYEVLSRLPMNIERKVI